MRAKESCKIISQDKIAEDIFSMWIEALAIANEAVPGQFVSLYCADKSRLLPRPISICEIDKDRGAIRLVYRTVGAGTEEFAKLAEGDATSVLGPLGNGFPLDVVRDRKVFLIGGGIGIPPMLEVAKELDGESIAICGYRDETYLVDDLSANAKVFIATEDGSTGTKGNVLDAIKANDLVADIIFACGPTPMLKAIKEYALANNIECYISMEERMACGVGACLACICQTKEKDNHSNVNNKRICKDGPVFLSTEVEL